MASCQSVADYLLSLVPQMDNEESENSISNLKMQKLLYYAQGFHLALYDTPLFDDEIVAWAYGPVVEDMYHKYKKHGASELPLPGGSAPEKLTETQEELLQEVHDVYGQFSAWKLRDMTHGEPPWSGTKSRGVISHRSMKDYFKTQLVP